MERIEMNVHEYESIIQDLHAVRLFRKLLLDQMQWSSIKFVGSDFDFGLKDIHVTEESFYKIIQAESVLDESHIKVTRSKDGRIWKSIDYMDFNIFCITDKE